MTKIKILGREDQTFLVEWSHEGGLSRAYVPSSSVVRINGEDFCENPERGVPHGLPWSLLIDREIDTKAFEQEMYRRGIWTYQDFDKNPQMAITCLQRILGQSVARIRSNILALEQGE